MRKAKKKSEVIEIIEDVRLPETNIILEKGDKIEVLTEEGFSWDADSDFIDVTVFKGKVLYYSRQDIEEFVADSMYRYTDNLPKWLFIAILEGAGPIFGIEETNNMEKTMDNVMDFFKNLLNNTNGAYIYLDKNYKYGINYK